MAEITQWYNSIPQFTRYWFSLSVAIPIAARLKVINPSNLILVPEAFTKLELWRPFTAAFYYPVGWHYLMNLYFLYNYSSNLETTTYHGRPADYLFMLIFNWFCALIICYFTGVMVMMDILVLSVIYVWSQMNKETIVTFLFGIKFKAMYLPWVLLCFNAITNGSGFFEILGILVGHLYYFVTYKYPEQNNGTQLISTPSILYEYFPSFQARGGFTFYEPVRPQARPEATPQRHRWGAGQRLGS